MTRISACVLLALMATACDGSTPTTPTVVATQANFVTRLNPSVTTPTQGSTSPQTPTIPPVPPAMATPVVTPSPTPSPAPIPTSGQAPGANLPLPANPLPPPASGSPAGGGTAGGGAAGTGSSTIITGSPGSKP
jgi:hypothetical protein